MTSPSPLPPEPPEPQVAPSGSPAVPGEVAGAPPGSPAVPDVPPGQLPDESKRAQRSAATLTRTSAVWFGVWAGVAVLILLIVFVAQNTAGVEISFLWMHGRISLALALLIAGVAGAVIAMAVAAARIVQLRRLLRRATPSR